MFSTSIYSSRRAELKKLVSDGILLLFGHTELPMNYPDNLLHFRQNSNFLYYFGLDMPDLAAVIDLDSGEEIIYGDDFDISDIIWMGPQAKMKELAAKVGVSKSSPIAKLSEDLKKASAKGRKIHFLPEYRAENKIALFNYLGIDPGDVGEKASEEFIKAVVAQRSVKSEEEIVELEEAHAIAYQMHTRAMRLAKPGVSEQHITGVLEGIPVTNGGFISFPIILSKNGHILHNHHHNNILAEGDLVIVDCGAENSKHYASDITRTTPVSGKFTPRQRDIYDIVLSAETSAIKAIAPDKANCDIHLMAAEIIVSGLKDLGLMKGVTGDAVAAGAHALFMPHGLGHMMGLDVHDMEDLGENFVGYDEEYKRSDQFGLAYLRLGKKLQPGYVLTVEPGIYFMPELFEKWRSDNLHTDFINYDTVEKYLGFGGIRIEDDVLVTSSGHRIIGEKMIPKTVEDVEAIWAEGL